MLIVVAIVSMANDRTGRIRTGYTMLSRPMSLSSTDTISTDSTVTFTITNLQKYQQHQVFTVGLNDDDGTPDVTITAYGKISSSGSWVQIGTPISWSSDSDDGDISSTTPINYNYLKVEFVAGAGAQLSTIDVFSIKTSNAYDIPANSGTLTISRATSGAVIITTADDDANAVTTYRAGGTGALTLGAGTGTTAITSSDWAISATGIATGMGNITSNGIIISANLKTTGNVGVADSSTVTAVEYGDGFHHITVLTLTTFIIGTPNAGNADDFGSVLYTFPTGTHVQSTMYYNIGLTVGTQTDDTPEIGIGSIEADGSSASLSSTEMDYITSNAWSTALTGGAEVFGPDVATAGALTGISLNASGDSKKVWLNAADTWNASVTGTLRASGTVIIVWDFLE